MTFTLLGQDTTPSATAKVKLTNAEIKSFWDSVLQFGETVVEKAIIPIAIEYFCAAV
jgi:hypothetical protein